MKKTALITGASSGIGRELANIHASKGGNLVIVSRTKADLLKVKEKIESTYNVQVDYIAKDLTKITSAQEIYDEIKAKDITIDYLMNNAGYGGQGLFYERSWEKDLGMIQVNVIALTNLTRLFLPDFVARNSGKILNTSSTASLMPGPLQAVYFATKSYVTSFSNSIASELEGTNVTVTALLPGAINTNFAKTSGMDKTALFDKTFSPKVVAKAGYNGMLEGKLNVLAGLTLTQKLLLSLLPLLPKKLVLDQIKKGQQITK
jgi:short-subunit dehydrogenase